MHTINAQLLYDLREQVMPISGTELHEIFNALLGDPSPSGKTIIEVRALEELGRTNGNADMMYSLVAKLTKE